MVRFAVLAAALAVSAAVTLLEPQRYAVLGGMAVIALVLLVGLLFVREAPALRSEKELNKILGVPMIAVRPLAPEQLSRQLLAHWFGPNPPRCTTT